MRLRDRVPSRVKRALRVFATEFPVRLRDAPRDVTDRLTKSREQQLPPASLRYHVAGTSDRASFANIGRLVAENVIEVWRRFGHSETPKRILDFGSGCGRVARYVLEAWPAATFTGVDVDPKSVRWCQTHLRGNYAVLKNEVLPIDASSCDFIYAISVFTHLSLDQQRHWLTELGRALEPNGVLLLTTLSPSLAYTRPDMSPTQHQELAGRGFIYLPGRGAFNENTSFQSREFLASDVAPLRMLHHERNGLARYQDLVIFTR